MPSETAKKNGGMAPVFLSPSRPYFGAGCSYSDGGTDGSS